jgi:spore coat polysaccharide biosynthesis protein SpsF (cytidylyltransferase family)
MIKSATFAGIDSTRLSDEEREHLTKFYYDHPSDFKIINIESGNPGLAQTSVAVDTLEDLHRIERTPQPDGARPETNAGLSSKAI